MGVPHRVRRHCRGRRPPSAAGEPVAAAELHGRDSADATVERGQPVRDLAVDETVILLHPPLL